MSDPQTLVVTSSGASVAAVVPVLAAIEATGMRLRAMDVGGAGSGGGGVAERVKRAILGEGAERRLRRELESSPPDVAVAFDPHTAIALTVARDQVQNPAPVVAIVADLAPDAAWAQTDADRFLVVDELAAFALAEAGVEADRILVVGAFGERAFAEAAASDRAQLRQRFGLGGKVVLTEVGGLQPEQASQLALQLSLLDGGDQITHLFDAGSDTDVAAVLRRQVPTLGLRAKLFGSSTADAPLLWRAADVVIARPLARSLARCALVGARVVALLDDSVAGGGKLAEQLEQRGRGHQARGLLLLAGAIDAALKAPAVRALGDGADHAADIIAVVAGDRRAIIDERRVAASAATREKVQSATAAANAAAKQTAVPGELEDIGSEPVASAPLPDSAEVGRLRGEVKRRIAEHTSAMNAARRTADEHTAKAKDATARGDSAAAAEAARRADGERARMHGLLGELATLEGELRELDRVEQLGASARRTAERADVAPEAPTRSIEDQLADLKKRSGGAVPSRPSAARPSGSAPRNADPVDDELAALKRKMQSPKKK